MDTTAQNETGHLSKKAPPQLTSHTPQGVDKTARYGWVTKDQPGVMQMLHKDLLKVHPAYQRDVIQQKVSEITAAWSWVSLGALVVGKRRGEYWVIDGQHRALAAKRRSDITMLPCVVFETSSVQEEALGFLGLNGGRKPVTAVAKHKAMVAGGDEVAGFVRDVISMYGLKISTNSNAVDHIKCVAWCIKRAKDNRGTFMRVMRLGSELCRASEISVHERILEGLWVLHQRCGDGLDDKRLVKRLADVGGRALLDGINRAAAYYATGGGRIWAEGMLSEVNKGLRNKFEMAAPGGTEADPT